MAMKVYISADDFEVTAGAATLLVEVPIPAPLYMTKIEIERLLLRFNDGE
jgi:hypothetical protein